MKTDFKYSSQPGMGLPEYAMIIGLVLLLAIPAVFLLGDGLNNGFMDIGQKLEAGNNGTNPGRQVAVAPNPNLTEGGQILNQGTSGLASTFENIVHQPANNLAPTTSPIATVETTGTGTITTSQEGQVATAAASQELIQMAEQLRQTYPNSQDSKLFWAIEQMGEAGHLISTHQNQYIHLDGRQNGSATDSQINNMQSDYNTVESRYYDFLDELQQSSLSSVEKQQIKSFVDTHAGAISYITRDVFHADIDKPVGTALDTSGFNYQSGQEQTNYSADQLQGQ
jgi:Flp pilus assembly pilin Flp